MSSDTKRSILGDLRKPLAQPSSLVPPGLEERLLGTTPQAAAPAAESKPAAPERPPQRQKVPTVPVTFHLPVALRDRLKITAQARQRTMLEIATEALEEYLERNPASEADLRRLLGL